LAISASDAILFLLAIILAAEAAISKRRIWHWPAAATPFALLVGWSLGVSLLRGPNTESLLAVLHGIRMLLFLVVFSSAIRTRDELVLLLVSMGAAVAFQVLLVGSASITGHSFALSDRGAAELMSFSGSGGEQYVRASGTVGHVNQEASFLTFFTLPLVGLLGTRNFKWWLAVAALIAGALVAIILTYSRAAWISIGAAAGVITLLAWRRGSRHFWRYPLPMAFAGALVLGAYSGRISARFTHGDEGATDSRSRANRVALDLAALHPIAGVGPGNYVRAALTAFPMSHVSNRWVDPRDEQDDWAGRFGRLEIIEVELPGDGTYVVAASAHNKFLLTLSELGLVGLALFVWFQLRILGHVRGALHARDRILAWTAVGLAGGFVATQLYMNLDLFAQDKIVSILFIIPVLSMITDRLAREGA
jgi:O-antigen ligase